MSWKVTSLIGAQPITDVSTTQNHPLGTRVQAAHADYGPGEFIYVKGVASGAANAWVTFNADDWSTALLAANAIGPVGIMMAALDATTDFGWIQVFGKGAAKVAASFADNGNLYATATAGTADDAVVAGDRIKGAKGASAIDTPSTGLAEVEIHYPFMDDALAA